MIGWQSLFFRRLFSTKVVLSSNEQNAAIEPPSLDALVFSDKRVRLSFIALEQATIVTHTRGFQNNQLADRAKTNEHRLCSANYFSMFTVRIVCLSFSSSMRHSLIDTDRCLAMIIFTYTHRRDRAFTFCSTVKTTTTTTRQSK